MHHQKRSCSIPLQELLSFRLTLRWLHRTQRLTRVRQKVTRQHSRKESLPGPMTWFLLTQRRRRMTYAHVMSLPKKEVLLATKITFRWHNTTEDFQSFTPHDVI